MVNTKKLCSYIRRRKKNHLGFAKSQSIPNYGISVVLAMTCTQSFMLGVRTFMAKGAWYTANSAMHKMWKSQLFFLYILLVMVKSNLLGENNHTYIPFFSSSSMYRTRFTENYVGSMCGVFWIWARFEFDFLTLELTGSIFAHHDDESE